MGGFMCEMRPAKLSAQSLKCSWPSAHTWFLSARWIDCADPTVAGLAVWAAALERKPKPRKPHPLGEPVHHSPLPEPAPAWEGCDLWGGVQTPPQRAHAARGAAHARARAGQSTVCLLRVSVWEGWGNTGGFRSVCNVVRGFLCIDWNVKLFLKWPRWAFCVRNGLSFHSLIGIVLLLYTFLASTNFLVSTPLFYSCLRY